MQVIESITPDNLARAIMEGTAPALIDVRDPWEFAYARIDQAKLMPLSKLNEWAATLDKHGSYVLMCHHGIRSEYACQLLIRTGFTRVINLEGGIDAWSRLVDQGIPRY